MKITVVEPHKNITVEFDDGQRRSFDPGADLIKLGAPAEVITAAAVHWVPDVLTAFTAHRVAQRDAPQPPLNDRDLSKPEFEYLLAVTGLDDVWDALEVSLKATNTPLYATLKSQRAKTRFRLDLTLGFVASVKTLGESLVPGSDLSETAIRAAWATEAQR